MNQAGLVDHENCGPCDHSLQLGQVVRGIVQSVPVGVKAREKNQGIKMLVHAIPARVDPARNLVPDVVEVDCVIAPHLE